MSTGSEQTPPRSPFAAPPATNGIGQPGREGRTAIKNGAVVAEVAREEHIHHEPEAAALWLWCLQSCGPARAAEGALRGVFSPL